VITLQSTKKNVFDDDEITALLGIAEMIAITLENMRLTSEIRQKETEIAHLHKQYLQDTWSITDAEEGEMQYTYDAGSTQDEKKSAINVPLALRDQLIGQLTLEGDEDWSSEDRKMVEDIATQAALSLESARLLEASQQLALREKLLIQVTSKIWEVSGAENVMQTGIKELARVLSADEATIQLEMDN
jgi:GAF domain-containing protein